MTKHGLSNSAEYICWTGMKQRCSNPRNNSFRYYGGRGIKVCDSWKSSFAKFFADMGPKPSSTHTIERKDRHKDYSPDNCVWADYSTQNRNYGRNRHYEFNGEIKCLQDWAREYGLGRTLLTRRLESGMSIEDALTTPVILPREKTHCKRGHPFSSNNLVISKSGQRLCKSCSNAAKEKYRRRLGKRPITECRKVTDEQLLEIKHRLTLGEVGKLIAAEFGIAKSLVSQIKTGKYRRLKKCIA